MSTPTVYVLAGTDGTTWHYLVPRDYNRGYPTGVTWEADGRPMTHTRDQWYSHPGLAQVVTSVRAGLRRQTGWQLRDPDIASDKYPATLTCEEADSRRCDINDDVLTALYASVYEQDEPERIEFPRDNFVDLGAGDPAPDDGLTWVASLPHGLEQHLEVLHLFPGHLHGFREALKHRLAEIPGVSAYDHNGFEVFATVAYDPPRQRWQGHLLRSGERSKRRGRQVQETLTRRQRYNPPQQIPGVNRAAAVEVWHAEMDRWVSAVTEMATVRACASCGGTGVTDPTKRDSRRDA